jgi:RNA polymerase sporulation-specific sigma factor
MNKILNFYSIYPKKGVSILAKYKVEIVGIDTNKLKVLKNEETIELFIKYQKGDKLAKEEIINGNLKLVLSIINKYNNGKHDMNDLFQIGCVGLIKAVDNFSLDYNVQFSTYAVPLIIGEVKRLIRDSSVVRISRSIRDNAYQILKYRDDYLVKNGVEPSNKQICHALKISEYELASALESLITPMSIYDPIYNDGGDPIYLIDQLADKKNGNNQDETISLKKALGEINPRESGVLYARYIYGKTQMEIASDLGVSQAQVSRIEKSAIKNIKRLMK